MKNILIIIIVLVSYAASAQDPRLFNNTWYLQKVIINGQDNFPPSNNEVPYVPLMIYESNALLETSVCNTGSGKVEYSLIDSSFFFTDGMALTLGSCYDPANFPFEMIYFSDFFNSGYLTVNDVFFYDIIDNGNSNYTLTLTSPSGDQAIYGNQILANNDFEDLQFAIYPNPASEQLTFTSKTASGTLEIQVFNVEGKIVKNNSFSKKTYFSMDISDLPNGFYFLKIQSDNGNVEVKKFIKE